MSNGSIESLCYPKNTKKHLAIVYSTAGALRGIPFTDVIGKCVFESRDLCIL